MIAFAAALIASQQAPARPAPDRCHAAAASVTVDGRYDAAARRTVARMSAGSPYRWVLPGSAVTQDWVPERLNLEVGDDGIVHRVWCG